MILYYAEFKNKQVRYWCDRGPSFLAYDSLPEAIKDNIAVLELAATSERIPGVGHKRKGSYQLEAVPESVVDHFYTINRFEDDE